MSDAPIPPAAFVGAGVNDALNSSITRADTAVTRRSRLNWPPSSDRIGILPYSLGSETASHESYPHSGARHARFLAREREERGR